MGLILPKTNDLDRDFFILDKTSLLAVQIIDVGEWIFVRLSIKEVDNPSHQLAPFPLVVFPQVISNVSDQFIELLYPSIDIALLRVSD